MSQVEIEELVEIYGSEADVPLMIDLVGQDEDGAE